MLILTAKVSRRTLTGGAAGALMLCCAALLMFWTQPVRQAWACSAPDPTGIRTNADRVEYLEQYGWEVLEEPVCVEELRIPNTLESSEYLELQKSQGFDLERCAGKRVRRCTYEITNYPSGESGVQASLLVRRNTVVGGAVFSPTPDGFLHGLEKP